MLSKARREEMTWRDLNYLTGTARPLGDLRHAPDNRRHPPSLFLDSFDEFMDQVVPILQKRGLYRADYSGTTLREHLGPERPANPMFTGQR